MYTNFFFRLNLILLAVFSFMVKSGCQTPEEKADQYISAHTGALGFSGVVLVFSSDSVMFSKGYGMANYEWDIPNTPDSKFRIASLSKAFTAALIMQLVEKGTVSLNAPISEYLPEFPSVYKDSITIHQLLCHTSGIPHYDAITGFDPKYTRVPVSQKEYIDLIAGLKLLFRPGTKYHYSSFGYYLLGAILERLYGMPYQDILMQNILMPAGMAETSFDDMSGIRSKRAAGYNFDQSGILNCSFEDTYKSIGCGGILTVAGDLLRWTRALNSDLLLSASSRSLLFRKNQASYGYGWILSDVNVKSDDKPHKIAWHAGSDFGFASYILLDLTSGDCIIVLSNLETAPVKNIGEGLFRIYTGSDVEKPASKEFIRMEKRKYSEYAGCYRISDDYFIDVQESVHGLSIQWTGLKNKLLMFPSSENTFFIRENDKSFTFNRNSEGKVISLSFMDRNDRLICMRIL